MDNCDIVSYPYNFLYLVWVINKAKGVVDYVFLDLQEVTVLLKYLKVKEIEESEFIEELVGSELGDE